MHGVAVSCAGAARLTVDVLLQIDPVARPLADDEHVHVALNFPAFVLSSECIDTFILDNKRRRNLLVVSFIQRHAFALELPGSVDHKASAMMADLPWRLVND